MFKTTEEQACCERHYKVKPSDLPLSCPSEHQRVWDAHPRVFLPIEKTGHAICPYCGAEYVLSHD